MRPAATLTTTRLSFRSSLEKRSIGPIKSPWTLVVRRRSRRGNSRGEDCSAWWARNAVIALFDDHGTEQVLEVQGCPVIEICVVSKEFRQVCSSSSSSPIQWCYLRPHQDRPRVRNNSAPRGRALGSPRSRGLLRVNRRQPRALPFVGSSAWRNGQQRLHHMQQEGRGSSPS